MKTVDAGNKLCPFIQPELDFPKSWLNCNGEMCMAWKNSGDKDGFCGLIPSTWPNQKGNAELQEELKAAEEQLDLCKKEFVTEAFEHAKDIKRMKIMEKAMKTECTFCKWWIDREIDSRCCNTAPCTLHRNEWTFDYDKYKESNNEAD